MHIANDKPMPFAPSYHHYPRRLTFSADELKVLKRASNILAAAEAMAVTDLLSRDETNWRDPTTVGLGDLNSDLSDLFGHCNFDELLDAHDDRGIIIDTVSVTVQ